MDPKLRERALSTLHKAPSVGSLVKKVLNVNPHLSTQEIIAMVREATYQQGAGAGDYAGVEVVDETKVLELARTSLAKFRN